MNQCSNISLVSTYHDGELAPDRAAELERHLACCPQCAAELEELNTLSRLIISNRMPAEISSQASQRLHRHIDELTDRSILRFAELLSGIAAAVLVTATVWVARPMSASAEPIAPLEQAVNLMQTGQTGDEGPIRTVAWMVSELSPLPGSTSPGASLPGEKSLSGQQR